MNYDTKRSSQSTAEQGLGDKAKYIFEMKTIDIMCRANALKETNVCSMVDVYYNKSCLSISETFLAAVKSFYK